MKAIRLLLSSFISFHSGTIIVSIDTNAMGTILVQTSMAEPAKLVQTNLSMSANLSGLVEFSVK